jgi:sarcosine oxidase, subunit alpha
MSVDVGRPAISVVGPRRVVAHPILPEPPPAPEVHFTWGGRPVTARTGEVISSALVAAGIDVFGRHRRDGAPQGLFCANGQCASCTVLADGVPVKACLMEAVEGMAVEPVDGVPPLPADGGHARLGTVREQRVDALIIGAGPAGLSAAAELGAAGISTLVVDDKPEPGGKLVLQTHRFFGSRELTWAGTRGTDIARRLADRLVEHPSVELWASASAVGVFADGNVGVVRDGAGYWLVEPRTLLVATGARERQLLFAGSTLPGVIGAGAFQTLVNRDQVLPYRRLLVVGAGNVGLIAAYHALQAGIEVAAVVEIAGRVGGYRVHADKLTRLGVPILLQHTVVAAHGEERVEAATIAAVGRSMAAEPDTARTWAVDGILIAAGLDPLDGLAAQARASELATFTAGDAGQVSEASAAILDGRLAARAMLVALGSDGAPAREPGSDLVLAALREGPGSVHPAQPVDPAWDVFPVLRCIEEIPCNPCATVCRRDAIVIDGDPLRGIPRFVGADCTGCDRCVTVCPGLAITVVDRRDDPQHPVVTVPFELDAGLVRDGSRVLGVDDDGVPLGQFEVVGVLDRRSQQRTRLVRLRATAGTAHRIAGIRVQDPRGLRPDAPAIAGSMPGDVIVCRCERVGSDEVRSAIRSGVRDLNEMKAMLRVAMGACGGQNCPDHLRALLREEGVADREVTAQTSRPLFLEVPLGVFAAGSGEPS